MGREQRRREEKKNKNLIKDEEQLDVSLKFSTLIKIIVAIVLILLVLYYILAVFVTKELDVSGKKDSNSSESSSTTSVDKAILAATIFNQSEETYYVYFYNFKDEDENIASVINSRSDLTIYRVNTNDGLNSKYITTDSGNKSATNLDNLKVKDPTLIEVTNDKITKYYEGSKEITNYLNG